MKRVSTTPRNNWQAAVEQLGFGFHTDDVPYWREDAYYQLTSQDVAELEKATKELWRMCLIAVQHVIDHKLYALFAIPEKTIKYIEQSWEADETSIYGRFDLGYDGSQIKLFEFNADTPTSLFEAGIVQWFWLQDFDKNADQFNLIHEQLIAYWKHLKSYLHEGPLHFACIKGSLEDLTTVEYMRDCAIQAGLDTKLLFMDDLGWDEKTATFVDMEDQVIRNIFKLYPWEWMIDEPFFDKLLIKEDIHWMEPAWKMILSNKAILPILWELFPESPYVLEAYSEAENTLTNYVRKPILSREGANIQVVRNGYVEAQTKGEYGEEGFICQAHFEIPRFTGKTAVIGSWIIGQEAVGIGIRESSSVITENTSNFIPHLIKN